MEIIKNISDMIRIAEERVKLQEVSEGIKINGKRRRFPGVYRVSVDDIITHYTKRSDKLNRPFTFKDEGEAKSYLDMYNLLAKEEFYHPDSKFKIKQDKEWFLISVMPKLDVIGEKKHIREKIKQFDLLLPEKELHLDATIFTPINYGYSPEGELYYHDLHVFAEHR